MVLYSSLFLNFPQFAVIHTVKGFGVVNEAEVDVFLEFTYFVHDPTTVGNLISGSSAFSISSLNIWKYSVLILLKHCLKDFAYYLASMWNECNCVIVWILFGIAFLWDWNENWSFPFLWPLLSFPNLLAYWVQNITASSFRIWNSSAGIPSPPLAFFIVKLPQVQLISHFRMSGSRWVITLLWLSGSLTSFLYSASVYSCPLFLISSASVRFTPFLSFIVSIFAWKIPLASLFFLKRSLCFPFYCFLLCLCIDHWGRLSYPSLVFFGTLHSNGNIFPFLLCLSLLLFSEPFVRPQTIILPFCISFSWGWFWSLPPVQCYEPSSVVIQTLCLSNLISWIYWSLPRYNNKGFDLGHTWMV